MNPVQNIQHGQYRYEVQESPSDSNEVQITCFKTCNPGATSGGAAAGRDIKIISSNIHLHKDPYPQCAKMAVVVYKQLLEMKIRVKDHENAENEYKFLSEQMDSIHRSIANFTKSAYKNAMIKVIREQYPADEAEKTIAHAASLSNQVEPKSSQGFLKNLCHIL